MHAGQVDETIDPVVVCNPDEHRAAGALRAEIGVSSSEPLAVVHQAGHAGEWARLAKVCRTRPLHVFSPRRDDDIETPCPPGLALHDGDPLFPLTSWLGDADTIVSGAGYNAYWEARWLGHDARTTFVAFPRIIDDQAWRMRACGDYRPRENGADTLARRLG